MRMICMGVTDQPVFYSIGASQIFWPTRAAPEKMRAQQGGGRPLSGLITQTLAGSITGY
jgi:hypothetical protein